MNKKISLGAALALMLIVTAVTFSITMIFFPPNLFHHCYQHFRAGSNV